MLDTPPTVYRNGGAPGSILTSTGDGEGTGPPPTTSSGFTAERTEVRPLAEVLGESRLDARLRAEIAEVAAALSIRPRPVRERRRGTSRPETARFDGNADELDLDRTLELLAERRPLDPEELYVRRPVRTRRSIALLADVSGSMDGAKARITAAAIGALTGELVDDELTVVAFWKDAAVLRSRESKLDAVRLVDELMRIEPKGLTNVHGAIELAARELGRSSLERRSIVLLSDCVHNAGPDPRLAAASAPPTHVLLERTGEHDAWLGERIARAGGGRFRSVERVNQVAEALGGLLSV